LTKAFGAFHSMFEGRRKTSRLLCGCCASPQGGLQHLLVPKQEYLALDTVGSFYPVTKDGHFKKFQQEYPDKIVVIPESGKYGDDNDFLLIRNDSPVATPENFLPTAVKFCIKEFLGSLCATVVVDEDTLKDHKAAVDKAVEDLMYAIMNVNNGAVMMYIFPHIM
jgi:hypothetical protein